MSTLADASAMASQEPRDALDTCDAVPTVEEITQLTLQELSAEQDNDTILECGRAALALLRTNPDLCIKLAYQKLHDVPYKDVKTCWRRLHTDATLWSVMEKTQRRVEQARQDDEWIDEVVRLLDTTLIMTAAPVREELIELWFSALEEELSAPEPTLELMDRPAKRLKRANLDYIPTSFPSTSFGVYSLTLRRPTPRCNKLSLSAFQKKLSSAATHAPLVIENAIQHWPALAERSWDKPKYLLDRTLGGRRLVPVETGRSYTDSGWGQKISTFRDFLKTYMLDCHTATQDRPQTGYLAQHDLFAQIPSLRADISIPDLCFCDPAPNPLPNIKETTKLEDPLLNAWFGPQGTISPLHTDPYHNILAQVVGYKYVRLYAPSETERLHPRGMDENGVDMSNTSLVDLDEAMDAFPEIGYKSNGDAGQEEESDEAVREKREQFEERFPGFKDAQYVECYLGPGDCLYLPPGWWHYVRSLASSFSVSFWFN